MYAVGGSLLGQIAVIYFPPLQAIFQTEALSLGDWIYLTSVASSILIFEEVFKLCAGKYIEMPEAASTAPNGEERPTARAYQRPTFAPVSVFNRILSGMRRFLPSSIAGRDDTKLKYGDSRIGGTNEEGNAVTLSDSQRMRSFYQPLARRADDDNL